MRRDILREDMKKKLLIALGGIAGVVFLGLVVIFFVGNKKTTSQPEAPQEAQTSQESLLATWEDPAGFRIQYPEELAVDKHEDDNTNYAHFELTSKNHPGSLIVWVKDTTAADPAAWAKTEPTFKGANILDTTLGGEPAKKVFLRDAKKLVVGTTHDGLLFSVESDLGDEPYWTSVANKVIDSFSFKGQKASGGSGATADEEPVDEEEVVE